MQHSTTFINEAFTFSFIKTSFFTPINEELIFRFILLSALLTKMSAKKALIISALVFGATHLIYNENQDFIPMSYRFLSTTFGGLVFGYFYIKEKNIYIPTLLHITVNFGVEFYGYWRDIGLMSTPDFIKYLH